MKKFIYLFLLVMIIAPQLNAKEIKDSNFAQKISIMGEDMVLNGVGDRKKAFINVYSCGLYLPEKQSDASEILNADKPMAIKLIITTGLVSKEKMQNAMNEGFENSTNGNIKPLESRISQFNNCFNDEIIKQDQFVMTYIPNSGVLVEKNGVKKGLINGLDFKKALFGIWLGNNPVDKKLKNGILSN